MTEFRKDEYKKVQISFGFNAQGDKVQLSLFHSFFVAMTGHGKTLGMKSLLYKFHEAYPEWKILIIDSKDKRDYADLSADVPICFVETTEPLDLKALLEPIVGSNLMFYFDKIIEESVFDTLGEIQKSINEKIVKADSGRLKMGGKDLSKLRVLNHLMAKLVALVEKPNIVKVLELHDGFNVMPIALPEVRNPTLKRAFQQLIVRSVLILLLSDPSLERTLLVLDEVHKWSPQRYGSICKQPLSEFVSEGRSQDKILWESDQALTKVDKEPLKNVKVWIVGQQMEANEVDDAKNTVNDITDLAVTETEIKTLKVGHFIVVDGLHGKVERAYLQPYNVPDEVAFQIALGAESELAEPFISAFEKEKHRALSHGNGEEEMYKQKFEKLEKDFEESQKKRKELEKEVARTASFDLLNDTIERLQKDLTKTEPLKKLRDDLFAILSEPISTHDTGVKINLAVGQTEISLADKSPREINMSTETPTGKIMFCAVNIHERLLKAKAVARFSSADLQKEAAEYGWNMGNRQLGGVLMVMIREGQLILEDGAYRLPSQVKISVKEAA